MQGVCGGFELERCRTPDDQKVVEGSNSEENSGVKKHIHPNLFRWDVYTFM